MNYLSRANDALKLYGFAAKSIGPLAWRALSSGQVFRPQCEMTPADPDVLCEYDVVIPMSDGTRLLANVFRSHAAAAESRRLPVVMCAHPYNNHLLPALGGTPLGGPPHQYRVIPQVGRPRFSTLTSWESPDPNFWVPSGYAVVNLNLPGYGGSEGPPTVMSEHQARCYHEAIEWVAARDWCTGDVGLTGVSYLAISQFHVASCQHHGGPPPSLRCIAPWEGVTDPYRDLVFAGGIPDTGFCSFWWFTEVKPALTGGDEAAFIQHNDGALAGILDRHPFNDAYWKEKAAKLEQITVPMLVCASFSDHGLHTVGSFRAFEKVASRDKWVYTHRTGKWDAFYSDEVQALLKQFMDCFVKGESDNGFRDRAPVRLEVRSSRDVVHAVRSEPTWPLPQTRYERWHLGDRGLQRDRPRTEDRLEYQGRGGALTFDMRFDRDTELTGYMKLRLWVQALAERQGGSTPDDMAIFVGIDKLDRNGQSVRFYGSVGNREDLVTRGYCQVSRRELDPALSTEWQPVLTGTSHLPLQEREIVPVDIALYPSSTFFAAGESLRLIISSKEIIPSPPFGKSVQSNWGRHVLHVGGRHDAYLLVPRIPTDELHPQP